MSSEFAAILGQLISDAVVRTDDVRAAFDAILAGAWTPVQVGAFAVALRVRGETSEIIVAAAQALRAVMTRVEHNLPVVVDTCGTGGDGSHTLNLSSAAAVVVAACGVPVGKHGNRSASSRCGSADVFEVLGIPLDIPPSKQGEILSEAGIAFFFAQAHHPALRHAAQARRELGTRTIFNALGPLANPALATHQLMGVYDDSLRPIAARALRDLGCRRAWIVRSVDGLDEVSPCAETRVSELDTSGRVEERVIAPEDFGIARIDRGAIGGADPQTNARAIGWILEGGDHPAREAVILNAAAALAVVTDDPLPRCAERARRALDDRSAWNTLERWRRAADRARTA